MEGGFFTLQDFMYFTKSVTYVIMVGALIAVTAFWLYLTDRDEDAPAEHEEEAH
jgi:hypothetical protein